MLRGVFKKVFNIRDGEIYISFLMQLYIFLVITALLLIKPTVNAIFLSKLGANQLPNGYILVALIAVLSSYFYNKVVHRFSIKKITILTFLFFGGCFLVLGFLLNSEVIFSTPLLYFYYVSVSLFAVLTTSQFWIIANMIYNAREAKRIFGFIGAGAIAGGIFGGYLTSIIATHLGNNYVIILAGILIVSCIPLLQYIWRLRVKKLNNYLKKQRQKNDISSYSSSLHLIIKSKHLMYLALITGVSVLIAKLVDFQFSDFANKAILDADKLASFFGFWFSTFSIVALSIQLFFTNRILSYLGVSSSLLLLPIGIVLASLIFLIAPELWVMVLIKGIDGSFKQSINKASIELAIMPIPHRIKKQAKSYIDVVVDSIATGIAGLLLIFVIKKLELTTLYVTVITLFFLFIWILLIYRLRGEYFRSFRMSIQNSLDKNEDDAIDTKNSLNVVSEILTNGSEQDISNVLNGITKSQAITFKHNIINLLDHEANQIKRLAIQQLYSFAEGTAVAKIKKLIYIKDDETVYAAMEYLMEHSSIETDEVFKSYLDHQDDYIANAALLCLAKESQRNPKLAADYELESRIEEKIQELIMPVNEHRVQEIAEMLVTVGYSGIFKYYTFITTYFDHADPYIVRHAIQAAGITCDEIFIDRLLSFLSKKLFRKKAIKALKNYGTEINRTILKLDKSETLEPSVQRYIPRVVESFGTQDSVSVLFRLLLSKEVSTRFEASRALNKLQRKNQNLIFSQKKIRTFILKETKFNKQTVQAIHSIKKSIIDQLTHAEEDPDLSLELQVARENLLEILKLQKEKSFQCIFKLLGLKYGNSDIEMSYTGWTSEKQEIRANTIEFLDNLLDPKLKNTIVPLMENQLVPDTFYTQDDSQIEQKCLTNLLKTRGEQTKLAVLYLMRFTQDTTNLKAIRTLLKHKSIEVRLFATHALEAIKVEKMVQSLD